MLSFLRKNLYDDSDDIDTYEDVIGEEISDGFIPFHDAEEQLLEIEHEAADGDAQFHLTITPEKEWSLEATLEFLGATQSIAVDTLEGITAKIGYNEIFGKSPAGTYGMKLEVDLAGTEAQAAVKAGPFTASVSYSTEDAEDESVRSLVSSNSSLSKRSNCSSSSPGRSTSSTARPGAAGGVAAQFGKPLNVSTSVLAKVPVAAPHNLRVGSLAEDVTSDDPQVNLGFKYWREFNDFETSLFGAFNINNAQVDTTMKMTRGWGTFGVRTSFLPLSRKEDLVKDCAFSIGRNLGEKEWFGGVPAQVTLGFNKEMSVGALVELDSAVPVKVSAFKEVGSSISLGLSLTL